MRDAWREKLAELAGLPVSTDLDGSVIWLGRAAAGPAAALADELTEVLTEAGASVLTSLSGPRGILCGLDVETIETADAVLMLGETPGVTAEAIDFCGNGPWKKALRPRLHVVLPDEHRSGYMYSRLNELGAQNDLYNNGDIDSGKLAIISLSRALSIYRTGKLEEQGERPPKPTIGIVTALDLEFDAVKRAIPGGRRVKMRTDGVGLRTYVHLALQADGGGEHQIVAVNAGMSNNKAVAAAKQLMNDYPSVQDVIMVGIAGGVPNLASAKDDVRLGDVVVSSGKGVIKYDMKKTTSSGDVANHDPRPPSHDWLLVAEELAADSDALAAAWCDLDERCLEAKVVRPDIDQLLDELEPKDRKPAERPHDPARIDGKPRVMFGPIGSADTVVKSAKMRDEVAGKFGIMAFEMEGSGVAEVTWQGTTGYLIVRGICDYCNDAKSKEWQPYAAAAAAAFARHLIASMPVLTPAG